MFDQIKDLYKLRQQAQEMQKKLADQKVTGTSHDNSLAISIDGNQEIQSIVINDRETFLASNIEKTIKQAFDDAQKKLKNILAHQFKDMLT